ncbi:glycosyltransferase family 39 protein [Sulfitobacter sp. LCG007]
MRSGLVTAFAIIAGVTLWRVVWLAWNGTDLFVDEAQYWLWGRNLDFGYYSKPPMIGWLIRLVTEVSGSSAAFWVRLPAPLLHMLTAILLMLCAREVFGEAVARWVGPIYVALPMSSVGSFMLSTDTVMLPFLALALWRYLRLLETRRAGDAVIAGLALGVGLLSKYAAIYFCIGMGLAALHQPAARPPVRLALLLLGTALLVLSPNLIWNAGHQAVTFRHTADNANWSGGGLHWDRAAEFFFSQFAVVGPVFFGALLRACWLAFHRRLPGIALTLLMFAMPVVLLVTGQALMSRAYANWAVAAYVAGTILAVKMLAGRPRWLWAGQALNLCLALALPVLLAMPERVTLPGGTPLFERYLGRSDVSRWAGDIARQNGIGTIVSDQRDLLADLHYSLRDTDFDLFATPPDGAPENYYEQRFAVPEHLEDDTLLLSFRAAPECPGVVMLAEKALDSGAYTNKTLRAARVPARCYRGGN